jgi:hypothetical protein
LSDPPPREVEEPLRFVQDLRGQPSVPRGARRGSTRAGSRNGATRPGGGFRWIEGDDLSGAEKTAPEQI